MDNLCAAIIDMACFLELSGSDVVDEDAAVAAMEGLGAMLQDATSSERQAFVSACHRQAERLRSTGQLRSSEFVRELPAALGLSEET